MKNPLPQPTKEEALNRKKPVTDSHAPVETQIKRWQKKDGKVPGHYGADCAARVEALENAVLALGRTDAEFAAAAIEFAGNPQALRNWYNSGAGGRVKWGVPGDFMACVRKASQYMDLDQAKGFCQNRHIDATGEAAGRGAHGGKPKH